MWVGGQHHTPAASGKETRHPLFRRLSGPQQRPGLVLKILPPPGFDPLIVQTVTSRCAAISTDRYVGGLMCYFTTVA
jgi:hypothetical protein